MMPTMALNKIGVAPMKLQVRSVGFRVAGNSSKQQQQSYPSAKHEILPHAKANS
jgi:hypothetical protein